MSSKFDHFKSKAKKSLANSFENLKRVSGWCVCGIGKGDLLGHIDESLGYTHVHQTTLKSSVVSQQSAA